MPRFPNVAAVPVALAAVFAAAAPIAAQESSAAVAQARSAAAAHGAGSYAFFAREIVIEIVADGPGTLRVVRGAPGRLIVSGRSDASVPAVALAGHARERLTLAAGGAEAAEFVVTIPEHTQLYVALPGMPAERVLAAAVTRLEWAAPVPAEAEPAEPVAPESTAEPQMRAEPAARVQSAVQGAPSRP
jgi:hypothetical protein